MQRLRKRISQIIDYRNNGKAMLSHGQEDKKSRVLELLNDRYLRHIVEDADFVPPRIPIPKVITLIPFDSCNQRCIMCSIWKGKDSGLSNRKRRNFVNILDALAKDFGTRDIIIAFSGGEIFQDERIFEIIEHASKLGFSIHIDSNLTLLTKPMMHRLFRTNIKSVSTSLDGTNPETHDKIRCMVGSYFATLNAIEEIYKLGVRVTINSVILKQNLDEIVPLVIFSQSKDSISAINLQAVVDPGFNIDFALNDPYFRSLLPEDPEEVSKVIDEVINLKRIHREKEIVKSVGKVSNTYDQLRMFKMYYRNPKSFVKSKCDVLFNMVSINSRLDLSICSYIPPLELSDGRVNEKWNNVGMRYRYAKMGTCRENCNLIVNCFKE